MSTAMKNGTAIAGTIQPAPVKRGFPTLPCLWCGEEGTVRVDLADLTGDDAFTCSACDAEFGVADVRARLDAWLPVLAWVEAAPAVE
jgi:hypothetical protein